MNTVDQILSGKSVRACLLNCAKTLVFTDENDHYTVDDVIELVNKAARTKRAVDYAVAEEAFYAVIKPGDKVFVEESDGKMYPFTLGARGEFTARLSKDLAYETDGFVATNNLLGELIYNIQHGRKWYLDLK